MPRRTTEASTPFLHANLPIIEVAEPWLLDMALADAAVARMVLLRLSEQVAVVAPGQFDALVARLRKLGRTPKVLAE